MIKIKENFSEHFDLGTGTDQGQHVGSHQRASQEIAEDGALAQTFGQRAQKQCRGQQN